MNKKFVIIALSAVLLSIIALLIMFIYFSNKIKSYTLEIALPSTEEVSNNDCENITPGDTLTLIIDSKRKAGSSEVDTINGEVQPVIYCYQGKPGGDDGILGPDGSVLSENNNLYALEILGTDGETNKAKRLSDIIKKFKKEVEKPAVIIKPTPQAAYGSLVAVFDEMQINGISKYNVDKMTKADSLMVIDYQNSHHN